MCEFKKTVLAFIKRKCMITVSSSHETLWYLSKKAALYSTLAYWWAHIHMLLQGKEASTRMQVSTALKSRGTGQRECSGTCSNQHQRTPIGFVPV